MYSGKRSTPRRPQSDVCMSVQESPELPHNSEPQSSCGSHHSSPALPTVPGSPKHPAQKLLKQKSMHDMLLSQSASKYLSQHGMPVSTPVDHACLERTATKKAPVTDLMHSLQVYPILY